MIQTYNLVSLHQYNDHSWKIIWFHFSSFFFKLTYSRVATSVVSMYRKNAEGVSWFYETLEGLNTAGEVDIILEYFKCPRPTSTSL